MDPPLIPHTGSALHISIFKPYPPTPCVGDVSVTKSNKLQYNSTVLANEFFFLSKQTDDISFSLVSW
jgi:hypothetical protein